ncbi:MAG TPA: hypothetical protein VI138_04710 [Candidatus Dormibacteraeota bacterium]
MLLALGCLVAGCAPGASPDPGTPPQASAGTGCQLTVAITSTGGTAWGTVTVLAVGRVFTFARAERTVTVPCGATVGFKERPTDSTDWPFQGWQLGKKMVVATSWRTVVTGAVRVTAVYLAIATPGIGVTPAPTGN